MIVVGAIGIVLGGVWFQMLVVFVTAVMIWELWMMIAPDRPTPGMLMTTLTASVMSGQLAVTESWALALFLIVPFVGASQLKVERTAFFLFALAIPVAGYGLIHFRADFGFVWLLWLMSVVIITDVFGYFAGRTFGGPKFWPSISPKKTWSGTTAGWVGAGIVGFVFSAVHQCGTFDHRYVNGVVVCQSNGRYCRKRVKAPDEGQGQFDLNSWPRRVV